MIPNLDDLTHSTVLTLALTYKYLTTDDGGLSEAPVRNHLKNVYATLTMSIMAASAGAYVHLFTDILKVYWHFYWPSNIRERLHLGKGSKKKTVKSGQADRLGWPPPPLPRSGQENVKNFDFDFWLWFMIIYDL